ncbi:MAG: hypothetical protein HYY06_23835 [Deltaproteobacteria bacterium]|nr:hypothetical protein [Deltaproteobacteria bacterium]
MRTTALALLAAACTGPTQAQEPPDPAPRLERATPAAAPLVSATPAPPAPVEPAGTVPLDVPGFRPAEHLAPYRTSGARPVVVVLHGNFDRPEWDCAAWDPIVEGRAFILCPRGIPRTDAPGLDRWHYGARSSILREVAAGRAALAARYPGRVDGGPDVWVGFSLGAFHLAPLARSSPDRYPRIVLVEGGLDGWDRRGAATFATRGGRKIAFACGRPGCRERARRLTSVLQAAGADARVAFAAIGHNFYGPLVTETRPVFDWLVEDDQRF